MLQDLRIRSESWPLSRPFRISRGVTTAAEVVVVEIRQGHAIGRGEAVPYPRYGESTASVIKQIESLRTSSRDSLSRFELLERLPAGAARNALDCALWDLEAQASNVVCPIEELPCAFTTALTISLDAPDAMASAARALAAAPLIKVKVDASKPAAQIQAVRDMCPESELIVDPNESWNLEILRRLEPVLLESRVALLEQPLPASFDHELEGLASPVPICADESCHTSADLAGLHGRFQFINIKLDKTGGLTAALELLDHARAQGFGIMVGCMICTSLSVAPALRIARHARFADLDGPLWLARDRLGGIKLTQWHLQSPQDGFWGEPHAEALWASDS